MLDFIDIGSSKGGSVEYGKVKFGTGYGIDIDPEKVASAQQAGYDVRHMDIAEVTDKARWCTAMHVIEHLDGYAHARDIVEKMAAIGEQLYITFPYFDCDGWLMRRGMRPFWSYWTGHPFCLTTLQFHNILTDLGLTYDLKLHKPILHSNDPCIVPLSAPKNGLEYDVSMGPKPEMKIPDMFKESRWTIR